MNDDPTSVRLLLADGRTLGWCELGASDGRPVMAFHGTPACRLLFAPAAGPAQRLGLRLIVPDRPGYGYSDPQAHRTLADWSADTGALMDHLGIDTAPILAVSGGGPYAVAAASQLGSRISGLALVSPLGEVGAPSASAVISRMERGFFLGLPKAPRLAARRPRPAGPRSWPPRAVRRLVCSKFIATPTAAHSRHRLVAKRSWP
ncbi:MAG: alpha/beta hydrolase [Hyphomicrobiaceae bacterium]